ncbi:hypothetical protein DSM104635_00069 [Terricaulis silvestris]|uniref:Uncharacterized protein n=1 Tax=Terricaulis silvestris TaxID=2686094 RepID=A0A6I6MHW8_9CAUL|nr:hypothetical protein DSM104635_00069 [Terricaulis silvestris]
MTQMQGQAILITWMLAILPAFALIERIQT